MNEVVIHSIQEWKDNGELIAACAQLGYLREDWTTLEPTYGMGTFWGVWRPHWLVGCDIDPACSPQLGSMDFTSLPWEDASFDAVVFDPPYKLNGRPDPYLDRRYGTHRRTRWQDRMKLIIDGFTECARVYNRTGCLLVKCQDQVVSGHKVWQTDVITQLAERLGLEKMDRFDLLSYRPQPADRRQVHSHSSSSQLLVFRRQRLRRSTVT